MDEVGWDWMMRGYALALGDFHGEVRSGGTGQDGAELACGDLEIHHAADSQGSDVPAQIDAIEPRGDAVDGCLELHGPAPEDSGCKNSPVATEEIEGRGVAVCGHWMRHGADVAPECW